MRDRRSTTSTCWCTRNIRRRRPSRAPGPIFARSPPPSRMRARSSRAASRRRQGGFAGIVGVGCRAGLVVVSLVAAPAVCAQDASAWLQRAAGAARIRNYDLVRCYYPDAKIIRIEPRSFRNAFPSLLPQQLNALAEHYFFRKGELARIAGLETQAFIF